MSSTPHLRRIVDGSQYPLIEIRSTIGRSEATVSLPLAAISRSHAVVERTPHGYVVRDLDSRNGTFLNGERLTASSRALRDGDEIVIGGVETLRFVDPQGTPVAPAIGRLIGVWIDPDSSQVWVDAQRLEPPLSNRQQALLELLDEHAGTIVSRERIIDTVWSDASAEGVSPGAIDSLVKRVQARLRTLQLHDDYVEVHRGRGIRLRR